MMTNDCSNDIVMGKSNINILIKEYLDATTNYVHLGNDAPRRIRKLLIEWYRLNRRQMPWRGDSMMIVNKNHHNDDGVVVGSSSSSVDDSIDVKESLKKNKKMMIVKEALPISAYGIWISEVMLQQTRVETVVDYWYRWMETYPTISSLSQATSDDVNKLWAGLGYYRRAQLLLKGAHVVMSDFNGILPNKINELLTIPGIGPYTAGAIASIAYNQCEAIVDGNVIRVLSRLYAITLPIGNGMMDKLCWKLAKELVSADVSSSSSSTTLISTTTPTTTTTTTELASSSSVSPTVSPIPSSHRPTSSLSSSNNDDLHDYDHSPREFNQALMELGALVCKPLNPLCSSCPIMDLCTVRRLVEHSSKNTFVYAAADDIDDDDTKRIAYKNDVDNDDIESRSQRLHDIEDIVVFNSSSNSSSMHHNYRLPRTIHDFPFKMVKKKVKDIIVSVYVLRAITDPTSSSSSSNITSSSGSCYKYLFVRRPNKGLLANQWEFPSIIINKEQHETNDETAYVEVPIAGKTAIDKINGSRVGSKDDDMMVSDYDLWNPLKEYLRTVLKVHVIERAMMKKADIIDGRSSNDDNDGKDSRNGNDVHVDVDHDYCDLSLWTMILQAKSNRKRIKEPIIHIFSHQKHYMHIHILDVMIVYNAMMMNGHEWTVIDSINTDGNDSEAAPTNINTGSSIGNHNDHSQCSSSSSSNSSSSSDMMQWMTSDEIIAKGITKGCKTILQRVSNIACHDGDDDNDGRDGDYDDDDQDGKVGEYNGKRKSDIKRTLKTSRSTTVVNNSAIRKKTKKSENNQHKNDHVRDDDNDDDIENYVEDVENGSDSGNVDASSNSNKVEYRDVFEKMRAASRIQSSHHNNIIDNISIIDGSSSSSSRRRGSMLKSSHSKDKIIKKNIIK